MTTSIGRIQWRSAFLTKSSWNSDERTLGLLWITLIAMMLRCLTTSRRRPRFAFYTAACGERHLNLAPDGAIAGSPRRKPWEL